MAAQFPSHAPRPAVLAGLDESADGVLSAWQFLPGQPPTALTLDQIEGVLERRDGVVWVHLNATASPAKQWIRSCTHLPEPIREDLLETDPRTRLEPLRSAVVGVIGDTVAGADPDPWRLATLHFYLDRQCLISTRRRPVSCASRLGRAVRDGLSVSSSAEILVWLLHHAAQSINERGRAGAGN